jgi:hypothetical protein
MAYLLAALGDPGVEWLKLGWCLLGALAAWLTYRAARPVLRAEAALFAGLFAAASTGMLMLTTSLNNEIPYLVLVVAGLCLWERVAEGRPAALAAWTVLNALACLVRVEHALFVGLVWLHLGWRSMGRAAAGSRGRAAARLMGSAALFAVVLVPWQLHAAAAVRRFNSTPTPLAAAEEAAYRALEAQLAGVVWDADARARRDSLPAFCRRTLADFLAATVEHRGGERVRAEDFAILDQAFGARCERLPERFFVALYGGLNFELANHAGADGGFDRGPLERPPPLAGGRGSYPEALVAGLPPPGLVPAYPPHLAALRRGYAAGFESMRGDPGGFLELAGKKLRRFWAGAALGFGGHGLPLGLDGVRWPVDLAVPTGPLAAAWRVALLLACVAGALAGRRRPALVPWILWLASKLVVTVAFFGYARQGAAVVPVVAVLLALGAERWLSRPAARAPLLVALVAAALLAVEGARFLSAPRLTLGGLPAGASDPLAPGRAADEHRQVRLRVE